MKSLTQACEIKRYCKLDRHDQRICCQINKHNQKVDLNNAEMSNQGGEPQAQLDAKI